MPFTYSTFISYRRMPWCDKCTQLFYELLSEHEQTYGKQIYYDKDEIKVGNDFPESIKSGIRQSMSILFFIVPTSISEKNPWCTWELTYFLKYEEARIKKLKDQNPEINENDCKQIIPILLKGDHKQLEGVLKEREFIDFREAMISLRKDSKIVKRAFKEIVGKFDSLRELFIEFENDIVLDPPPFNYKKNAKQIGYKPFPTIKLKEVNVT